MKKLNYLFLFLLFLEPFSSLAQVNVKTKITHVQNLPEAGRFLFDCTVSNQNQDKPELVTFQVGQIWMDSTGNSSVQTFVFEDMKVVDPNQSHLLSVIRNDSIKVFQLKVPRNNHVKVLLNMSCRNAGFLSHQVDPKHIIPSPLVWKIDPAHPPTPRAPIDEGRNCSIERTKLFPNTETDFNDKFTGLVMQTFNAQCPDGVKTDIEAQIMQQITEHHPPFTIQANQAPIDLGFDIRIDDRLPKITFKEIRIQPDGNYFKISAKMCFSTEASTAEISTFQEYFPCKDKKN